MKITSTIARYLLGLIFVTFGLNGFLHFIPIAAAYGRCSAVLRGPLRVPVLRGDFSVADNARGPVACESGKNCATPKTSSPACWPGVAIISVLVPAVRVGSRRGFSSVVISSAY